MPRKRHNTSSTPTRDDIIAELERFNHEIMNGKLPIAIIADDTAKMITRPDGFTQLLKKWLPKAKGHEQDLTHLLLLLWNVTPQPDRGGKTAVELAEAGLARQPANSDKADWTALMPLMHNIENLFQGPLWSQLPKLPKKKRNAVLDHIHLLWFRYWHTCCPELLDWSPALAVPHELKARGLKTIRNHQFRTYKERDASAPGGPEQQIRTSFSYRPLTSWPLYEEYCGQATYFETDGHYDKLLSHVRGILPASTAPPDPQHFVQLVLELCLCVWYENDALAQQHFTMRSWYIFWRELLQSPLKKTGTDSEKWWVIDEWFDELDARTGQLNTKALSAFNDMAHGDESAMQLLIDTIGTEELGKALADGYIFGCNIFHFLVVPFSLYLPIMQPLWQEPLNVTEELNEFQGSQETFPQHLAKPPAMLRPTTYGARLLAKLTPEPSALSDS